MGSEIGVEAAEQQAASSSAEAAVSFRGLLEGFRERLDRELAAWLERRRLLAQSEASDSLELAGKLDPYVLRGGKRLRPALLFYAFRGCGGREERHVLPACLAVELLHTYLLIHDDIMDHAATRRGQPSAHVVFADEHRARGWSGDAAHHGTSVAILLGDLAHTYADELFAEAKVEGGAGERVRERYSAMCREVILGQYLEMTAAQRPGLREEDLLEVLRMKSGSYSVERPVELGALLAGAAESSVASLCRMGAALGEAFQLRDDLLGLFGDRSEVGKPVGGDLVEGKLTLLVFHALRGASEAGATALRSVLGNAEAQPAAVDRAIEVVRESGAEGRVLSMIDERLQAARRVLDGLELAGEGRAFFAGLIEYLRERKR
jgi:geranylgeranyl diphosphate synthase, type I